jgi:hypothetical protein
VWSVIDRTIELNKNNVDYINRIKKKLIIFVEIIVEKIKTVEVQDNTKNFLFGLINLIDKCKYLGPDMGFRKNTFSNPVSKQISEAFKERRNSAQAFIRNRTKKNERKQNIYKVLNKKENARNNTNRKKLNNFRKEFPQVENDYFIERTRNMTNANLNANNLTRRLNRLKILEGKRNNNITQYDIKRVMRALERKSNMQGMKNMRAMEV